MLNSLKKKWKIKSNFQFLIIMLVFSITGSLTLYIVDPLLLFLNISDDNFSNFQYWFLRIFYSVSNLSSAINNNWVNFWTV